MACFMLQQPASSTASRRVSDFNFDWRFALGDPKGVHESSFDDSGWRSLRLPHDWSVEASFDEQDGEGATGYLPGGIGCYRKSFQTPTDLEARRLILSFDGVYNNAEVWLNGVSLGKHPYGYSPFYFDITERLATEGGENVVAVRVDHSAFADSRWYTGSGIYRDVKLIEVSPVHVPLWGTCVTTPNVTPTQATVDLRVTLSNGSDQSQAVTVETAFVAPDGRVVAQCESTETIAAGAGLVCEQQVSIASPALWGIESPQMYQARTVVLVDGREVDCYETDFGIRTLRFDQDTGFYLNGEHTLIKGVCLHHDAGLVGAAVPDAVWERRLKALRAMGCNAIRTAHNPPSEAFLDLCDRMGFLVQHEFYDEWDLPKDKRKNMNELTVDPITQGYVEHFQEHAESDLKRTMLRDRNHPCIFMWSIGNEIEWCYTNYKAVSGYWEDKPEGEGWDAFFKTTPPYAPEEIKARLDASDHGPYVLADTAKKLAGWTRELDTTRPIVANMVLPSVSHDSGYVDALDVAGYSYRRVLYDSFHEQYPDKMIMGTENWAQWHEWKAVLERPFIPGIFLWTGIDYLGEADGRWPAKGLSVGMFDFAGFDKPSMHMMKSLWLDESHVQLFTQTLEQSIFQKDDDGQLVEKEPGAWQWRIWTWHDVNRHWQYEAGQEIVVEAYSNCDALELFLNGRSLGVKHLADFEDHIYRWAVPFEAGELSIRGVRNQQQAADVLVTASEPVAIELSVDRDTLAADGYDAAHVVAQLKDAAGNRIYTDNRQIAFEVQGDARVLGVDSGALDSVQDYASDRVVTHQGRCLLILQAGLSPSQVVIRATGEGLGGAKVVVTTA